jgi:hypothetical protein
MGSTKLFAMRRGGKEVAQVVELASGKCVVSWPTSVIVYDSLDAARAVHIDHMGQRGERTSFLPVWGDGRDYNRGVFDCIQDGFEGCWGSSVTNNFRTVELTPPAYKLQDPDSYLAGYCDGSLAEVGPQWRDRLRERVLEQQAARAAK